MTTKTEEKTRPRPQRTGVPSPEEIQAAYRCHALARILYGQIAATYPWVIPPPSMGVAPPMPGVGAAAWTPAQCGIGHVATG